VTTVEATLRRMSKDFFKDINFETLVARSKPVRNGAKIWGDYRGRHDRDSFELIITHKCQVIKVVYNNIFLSSYVKGKL